VPDPGQFPAPRWENIQDVTLGLYYVLLLETEPAEQQRKVPLLPSMDRTHQTCQRRSDTEKEPGARTRPFLCVRLVPLQHRIKDRHG